jgi:hypothetical protein
VKFGIFYPGEGVQGLRFRVRVRVAGFRVKVSGHGVRD